LYIELFKAFNSAILNSNESQQFSNTQGTTPKSKYQRRGGMIPSGNKFNQSVQTL
jgi:hypothetical protein